MTAAVIPFAFEDQLVRVVKPNGEPWFVGKDVCEVLSIRDHHQALDRLDQDERGGYNVPTPSGEQNMVTVSEPGVYRLIFTSRKPEAERFKRWLAHEVLPQLRKQGFYATEAPLAAAPVPSTSDMIDGQPLALITAKLSMVRESRLIHGLKRAEAFWDQLGLPKVPGGKDLQEAEARACLAHLLDQRVFTDGHTPRGDITLRQLIRVALNGEEHAAAALRDHGIRVYSEGETGFAVANAGAGCPARYFHGTRWRECKWGPALRHYPGARKLPVTKFAGSFASMGVFIPADAIEDEAPPAVVN